MDELGRIGFSKPYEPDTNCESPYRRTVGRVDG